MITIRPADREDAEYIRDHLRADDAQEIAITGGSVVGSFDLSRECYAATPAAGGNPFCIFGVCDSPEPGLGVVWLLATDEVLRHRGDVLRESSYWVWALALNYPRGLYNAAWSQNHLHIKWCRAAGFTERGTVNVNGHDFTVIHYV